MMEDVTINGIELGSYIKLITNERNKDLLFLELTNLEPEGYISKSDIVIDLRVLLELYLTGVKLLGN